MSAPNEHRDTAFPKRSESEAGPPPLARAIGSDQFTLGAREELVASELARVDPQLEALFRVGHELCSRGDVPGLSYVIAEAGRELSVGIINALAEGAPELTKAEEQTIGENEKHRGTIARALRLHPQHPLATAWHEMHRRLNGEAHFVANRKSLGTATSDFRELSSLISGRIAPYFDAQDEADALLGVQNPSQEHSDALRRILVRPALRRYFLQSLQNPAWLELLLALDAFGNPPRRLVNPDESWSMVAWVEGDYLARIASSKPTKVAEILQSVPTDNDNPAVWDAVARAGAALPSEQAVPILARIVIGLRSLPRIVLPSALIELAEHVAPIAPGPPIELLNVVLWMRRREDVVGARKDEDDLSVRLRYSTSWLLERVDLDDAQEVLARLVPAITRVDPRAALDLLAKKLRTAMRGVNPDFDAESARETVYWCPDFEGSDDRDDLRAMFARSMANVAVELARHSEGGAEWAASFLRALHPGVGSRLLYFVVSRCAPHLRREVDDLLRRPDVFEWEMPGREVGEVLRLRFAHAGPDAQAAFLRTLEGGPSSDELAGLIEWRKKAGRDISPEAARADWQRRHLRRFGTPLPQLLASLAEKLSYVPAAPSQEELALTELGWHSSGGASWVSDRSPLSVERLQAGKPEDIAKEIRDWPPEGGIDRPTLRGLEEALERITTEDPVRGLALGHALLDVDSPRGIAGVLRGVVQAQKNRAAIPWAHLGTLLRQVLTRVRENEAAEWRQVRSSAVDTVEDAGVEHGPPPLVIEWFEASARLLAQPSTWTDDDGVELRTMDGIITASINVLPGRLTRMLIRLALRQYRDRVGNKPEDGSDANAVRQEVGTRLHTSIPIILAQSGRPAIAARAALGTHLPQLVWFSPEWWTERAHELVGEGIANPLKNPIWAAYLIRAPLYNNTFVRLRPWYAAAALIPPRHDLEERNRTWEPEQHFVEHILTAMLRGLAGIGDPDGLVENAFANARAEDSSHAYWAVFRGWTDAAEKGDGPPPVYVGRLAAFWEWRVEQLEATAVSDRVAEEASGLLWFCRTPFIPLAETVRLGNRTLALVREASGTLHGLWERLDELAATDPDGTFKMLERAVIIELGSRWPHFPVDNLEPVFAKVFAGGSAETKAAGLRLLNRLGDEGYSAFGRFRPVA